MASRVNTRFVAILASALVGLVGVAAFIAYRAMAKTAGDLATAGESAAAAGNYEEAVKFYSRAVNKEQRNLGFINKWIDSLEKLMPKSPRDAGDRFPEYMSAIRAAFDSDKTNLPNARRMLTKQLDTIGLFGAGGRLADWEGFFRISDDTIKAFTGVAKDKDVLRFYRGFAVAGIASSSPDLAEDRVRAGIEDLNASLVAEPGNAQAVLSANQLEVTLAEQARKRRDDQSSAAMMSASRSRLQRFVADHPPAPTVQFRLLVLDLQDAARAYGASSQARKDPFPGPALTKAREDRLKDIVQGMRTMKAEDLDIGWTLNITPMIAEILPDGKAINNELIDKLKVGHPKDVAGILLSYGGSLQSRGEFEEAERVLSEVLKQPSQTLSIQGVRLPGIQASALSNLTEIQFLRWLKLNQPDKQAERDAIAGTLDQLRKDMLVRVSETDAKVIALDARRLLTRGDLNGSRTLATRFNELTDRRDVSMLALEADILNRGGNSGAAKQTFQRIIEINPNNAAAYIQLGEIETRAQNICEAAKYFVQASTIVPADENLKERARRARELCQGGVSDDPDLQAIKKANEYLVGLVRDPAKAIDILEKAREQRKSSAMLTAALAQVYFSNGQPDKARTVVSEGIAANPNNPQLEGISKALEAKDPIKAQEIAIENSTMPAHMKDLARWELLSRLPNRLEEARGFLAKAKAAAPEDPWVAENLFQDALTRKDKAELLRLTEIAERANLDQVNGLIFRARVAIADEKFDEATKLLKDLVAADKFNVLGWRLLGMIALQKGDAPAAAAALSKAVDINPLDIPSSKAYIKALMAQGKLDDGLAIARRIERTAGGDQEFANMLLSLESDAPSGNKARAIEARRALAGQDPKNLLNRVQLAELLIGAQRFDEAKAIIDDFRKDSPGLGAIELEARWLLGQRRVADAAKLYTDYSNSLPADQRKPQIYLSATELLLGGGAVEESLKLLELGKSTQDSKTREIDRMIGDVHFTSGGYDASVKAYEAVLADGSPDEGGKLGKRIIEALLRQEKWGDVEKRLAALGETSKTDVTLVLLAAEAAAGKGERSRARGLYDQAIKLNSRSPIAFLKRADFNRPDVSLMREVEQDYEQVLKLDPSVIIARVRLGNLYAETGRTDLAIDQFRQATVADPFDSALRDAYLDLLLQRGRKEEAVSSVEDYLKLQPDNPNWIARGGLKMLQFEKYDRAAELLAKVWQVNKQPDVAMAYLTALLGKSPADLTTANDVMLTPELRAEQSSPLRLMRARWYRVQKKLREATAEVLAAVSLVDQKNPQQALQLVAGLDSVYPTTEEFITALDRLEERSPFTNWLSYQAAMIRLRDQKNKPAVLATLKNLSAGAEDMRLRGQAFGLLGTLAYGDGDYEEAAANFKRGLEVTPENAELLNNLAFCLAVKLDRGQEALPLAEKAIKLNPNNSGLLDTLAMSHFSMKQFDKATEFLGQAMSLARTEVERAPVLMHLAKVRLAQSNRPEARRLLQQAEQVMNNNPSLKQSYDADLKALWKQLDAQ